MLFHSPTWSASNAAVWRSSADLLASQVILSVSNLANRDAIRYNRGCRTGLLMPNPNQSNFRRVCIALPSLLLPTTALAVELGKEILLC